MLRFRLKRGRHSDGKKLYSRDEIIESPLELDKKFGSDKFERLEPALAQEAPYERAQSALVAQLEELTLAELKAYANEEEIDLTGAKTKEEVKAIILRSSED